MGMRLRLVVLGLLFGEGHAVALQKKTKDLVLSSTDTDLLAASPIRLVVLACKRPAGLGSLLGSLLAVGEAVGFLGHQVPLDILVDVPKGESSHEPQTLALANAFNWTFGPLTVTPKPQHSGARQCHVSPRALQ